MTLAEGAEPTRRLRRLPAIVLIVAALVGGVIVDLSVEDERRGRGAVVAAGGRQSEVASGSVLSATWYCAVGTAGAQSPANGSVILANSTNEPRRATVTVMPSEGSPVQVVVDVPPLGRGVLRYADVLSASFAGSSIEIDGGGVAVEQSVAGPLGEDVTPCTTAASDRWEIANGVTAKDATMFVGFLNPFAGDAIVEMRFATEEGAAAPAELQALVVPARSIVVRDIGEHVRRREQVSASVRVRSGRQVVVARLQMLSGSGRQGLGLTLGAEASETWYFPDGMVAAGITERFELYNPSNREAVVELSLVVDEAEVEPFELTVPARGRHRFTVNEQERIPKDKAHAVTVRSLNDVAVVVEQTVDAVAPAPRAGFLASSGSRRSASRWIAAAGGTSEELDEWIVVQNVGVDDALVKVSGLAGQRLAIEGLGAVPVPAGRRVAIRISDRIKRDDLPLLIEADEPVVIVRSLYRLGKLGISSTAAIPLAALSE